MKKNDLTVIGLGLAGLYLLSKLNKAKTSSISLDEVTANTPFISSNPNLPSSPGIPSRSESALTPGVINFYTQDGATNTIYRADDLSWWERFLASRDADYVDEDGKLNKQPTWLIPGLNPTKPKNFTNSAGIQQDYTITKKTGGSSGGGSYININTNRNTQNPTVVTIPTKSSSALTPGAKLTTKISSSGQVTTYKTNTSTKPVKSTVVTSSVTNGGNTTTYKGTKTQVAVGKAVDKAKSLISSITKKFKK